MTEVQLSAYLLSATIIFVLMTTTWLVSLVRRDAGVVDICWGAGFAFIAWAVFLNTAERNGTDWLLPVLTSIWALRLSMHLAIRNYGKPEDFRYRALQTKYNKQAG